MDKINILVIGRHSEITATIVRLINNNPAWAATGCLSDEEAITAFNQQAFSVILLGGGIESLSEDHLCNHFRKYQPSIKIIQHYGGGSGLLSAEIYQALR